MYGNLDTPELRQLAQASAPLAFRVLVIGPQGSGKSTLAAGLAAALKLTVAETSDFLMRQYAAFKACEGCGSWHGFSDKADYADWLIWARAKKDGARRALVAFGDTLTALWPDFLIGGAASEGQIIVGARRKIEMEMWFMKSCNDQDVIVEIIHDKSPDDVYELADWKRERRASSGGIYRTAKADYAEWAPIAAYLAQTILHDKQMQAEAAAK